jgi:hypothetical protein
MKEMFELADAYRAAITEQFGYIEFELKLDDHNFRLVFSDEADLCERRLEVSQQGSKDTVHLKLGLKLPDFSKGSGFKLANVVSYTASDKDDPKIILDGFRKVCEDALVKKFLGVAEI